MMFKKLQLAAIAACLMAMALGGAPALAQNTPPASGSAPRNAAAAIKRWDRSGKGVLDLKAVSDAAMVQFEMLDMDHNGRLTEKQLASVLTPQEFAAANLDRDATIGAEEWFDLVRRRFYAANPDHDGSLSLSELKTPAGQALLKLIPMTTGWD